MEASKEDAKRLPLASSRARGPMYIKVEVMYIVAIIACTERISMAAATKRIHKHFQFDATKIKRAQKALHAKTETEAIERALDFAIGEHEKNRLVLQATERFLKGRIAIRDVYGSVAG